jgi:hypothetical protein
VAPRRAALATAHPQHPVNAAADDRFARRDVVELTIELATYVRSISSRPAVRTMFSSASGDENRAALTAAVATHG